ncbi:hypothetical protein MMC17_005388 [Xylographa soralifera]|nr:hypothetical protein [Xylographa soralifera]
MCHLAILYHPTCAHVARTTLIPCPNAPCANDKIPAKVVPLPEGSPEGSLEGLSGGQLCTICAAEEQAMSEAGLMAAVIASVDRALADLEADAEREARAREAKG